MLERIRSFASDQGGATSLESVAAIIAVSFILGVAWLSVSAADLWDTVVSLVVK